VKKVGFLVQQPGIWRENHFLTLACCTHARSKHWI